MSDYYCKHCGTKSSSISSLTTGNCIRHPAGAHKGKHALYEGSEKSRYECKFCGTGFPNLSSLTTGLCIRHPSGSHKGKHEADCKIQLLMNPNLSEKNPVESIPIKDVAQWTKDGGFSRLFLPPIQRSLVWRNSQIINYWDSLLRGYPAGLMMVHNPKKNACARTTDGHTGEIRDSDFQLFDGQQRLTAILLGLGEDQLKDRLKLWVDFGNETPTGSDLRFSLRINSTGQPFGYQPNSPNEKPPLHKRRDKVDEWLKNMAPSDTFRSEQAFRDVKGGDIIDAVCAVPLQEIANLVQSLDSREAIATLRMSHPAIPVERLESFVQAIGRALDTRIVFQLIAPSVIEDEAEYSRVHQEADGGEVGFDCNRPAFGLGLVEPSPDGFGYRDRPKSRQ